MKARHLVGCILIGGGIAFFLLRPTPKPKTETSQEGIHAAKPNAPETLLTDEKGRPSFIEANATNGPLAGAYEMAAFIDQVINSLPPEDTGTRLQLKGFQVAFFLNDYVMVAKTNKTLVLTSSAIADAFTNVSPDTAHIRNRLRTYAERPGTLTDHYQSISEIPTERENIKAIKTVMTQNGIAIDTESDLLMDCIRYAYFHTFINEAYGPNPRRTEEATPFPAALNELVNVSDTMFRHRFETRFRLNPDTVAKLMSQLKEVHIYDVSDADMQIPVQGKL